MGKTGGNLALVGHEERIVELVLGELHPPEFHPFVVSDDDAMNRLAESIRQNGVREPGLARPRAEGGFELLCGNRRKRGCELAGLATMPIIVRDLDDAEAVLVMVDSNLQSRERILPSEKAAAYRVIMEALNHNGVKGESHSYQVMVERTGESKNQLFRIIRLTELIAPLSDMVDAKQLAFNPAVELSYLSIKEQAIVVEVMSRHEVRPSLSQAIRLKKLRQAGELTPDVIDKVLSEEKKPPQSEVNGLARFRRFFPTNYSQKQMDMVIVKLLENWRAGMAISLAQSSTNKHLCPVNVVEPHASMGESFI